MASPAGELVRAFGDVDTMLEMYADDIVWSLPATLGPFAGPHVGREAVEAFNRTVWGTVYSAHDVEVEVLDEVHEGDRSAVRFIYCATFLESGVRYENHYTLFARCLDGCIVEVHEGLDTLHVQQQAQPAGDA